MRHFAEHGYQGAARRGHRGRARHREGLDLPALRVQGRAVPRGLPKPRSRSLPAWLDAPKEVLRRGVLASRSGTGSSAPSTSSTSDWVPYRVTLIGNYGTDLELKREINRFLVSEDPYGTLDVRRVRRRGAARCATDLDVEMAASMIDWLAERAPGRARHGRARPRPVPSALEPPAAARARDRPVRRPPASGDRLVAALGPSPEVLSGFRKAWSRGPGGPSRVAIARCGCLHGPEEVPCRRRSGLEPRCP